MKYLKIFFERRKMFLCLWENVLEYANFGQFSCINSLKIIDRHDFCFPFTPKLWKKMGSRRQGGLLRDFLWNHLNPCLSLCCPIGSWTIFYANGLFVPTQLGRLYLLSNIQGDFFDLCIEIYIYLTFNWFTLHVPTVGTIVGVKKI